MVIKINIFDLNGVIFSGYTGLVNNYTKIEYVHKQNEFDGITVFTDKYLVGNSSLINSVKSKYKVAWIVEPKIIYHGPYTNIINLENSLAR